MRTRTAKCSVAFAALALALFSCGPDTTTRPIPDDEPLEDIGRVLFLGNSLTFYNNLPLMVAALAAASGISMHGEDIARPGYGLIDHYDDPATRRRVTEGDFDTVILQQGPSSLPESRDSLLAWSALWTPVIRASGARPAFLAVWPEKARMHVFPDVSRHYREAADAAEGLFFPVGDTWLEVWSRDAAAPLYGPDDFHPAPAGSYAAAVVILAVLSRRDPTALSSDYLPAGVTATLAATIRESAAAVLARPPVSLHDPAISTTVPVGTSRDLPRDALIFHRTDQVRKEI